MAQTVWNQVGSSAIFYVVYNGIELAEIKENGVLLDKLTDTSLTSGSFFHDRINGLLYIRATDDTNPNTNGYNYTGFSWFGFCDRQPENHRIDFAIQGFDKVYYEPFVKTESMAPINQSVNQFYLSNITSSFGGLKFSGASFFYDKKGKYEFNNADIVIKYGEESAIYSNYVTFFHGLINDPSWDDSGFSVSIKDLRLREFGSIPPGRYTIADYPKLNTGFTNTEIPVLLGNKTNITPVEINTEDFTYKISQTTFGGVTYDMEEITAVKKDGVTLTITTDYTQDLTSGEFTLLVDPDDSLITCDAKGLKIDYDYSGEVFTDTYSNNIADITFFVLHVLDEISIDMIDLDTFDNIKDKTGTLICGDYISSEINTINYIPILQATGNFHLVSDSEGNIKLTQYRSTGDINGSFADSDYLKGFKFKDDTKSFFVRIIINYDLDPTNNNYREKTVDNDSISNPKYIYQENRTKPPVNTIITDPESAIDSANFYSDFFSKIPIKADFKSTDFNYFILIPTNKISLTKTYIDELGNEQIIFDAKSFVILNISKNLVAGTVTVKCQSDVVTSAGKVMLYPDGTAMEYESGIAMTYEGG